MRPRGALPRPHPSTTGWPPRRLPMLSRTCWPAHTWRAGRWATRIPAAADEAVREFQVSQEASAGLPALASLAHLGLGQLYYAQGKLVAAKSEFAAALAAMPANADVQAALGDLALREGDAAAALAAYDLAVGLLPDYALQSADSAATLAVTLPRGAAWHWCGRARHEEARGRVRRCRRPGQGPAEPGAEVAGSAFRPGQRLPHPQRRSPGGRRSRGRGVCGRHPVRPFPGNPAQARWRPTWPCCAGNHEGGGNLRIGNAARADRKPNRKGAKHTKITKTWFDTVFLVRVCVLRAFVVSYPSHLQGGSARIRSVERAVQLDERSIGCHLWEPPSA